MDKTNKKRLTAKDICECSLFTVLIIVGGLIKIPIPLLPFTLQTLFVLMAGGLLGSKKGVTCCVVYMFLGLIGLPIFASGGGIGYVLNPSFGYILGFIIGTLLIGILIKKVDKYTHKVKFVKIFLINLLGILAIYAVGIAYYCLVKDLYLGETLAVQQIFLSLFLLMLPADVLKSVLSAIIVVKVKPLLNHQHNEQIEDEDK